MSAAEDIMIEVLRSNGLNPRPAARRHRLDTDSLDKADKLILECAGVVELLTMLAEPGDTVEISGIALEGICTLLKDHLAGLNDILHEEAGQ